MKRILLLSLVLPLGAFAQSSTKVQIYRANMALHHAVTREGGSQNFAQRQQTSPIAVGGNHLAQYNSYAPATSTVIGTTTYDLQTNGALAKRLQLYSGNKMSYVWIKSDTADPSFAVRYSGYNTYNGSQWYYKYGNRTSIEYDRCGWPNIGQITDQNGTHEMLTSHYAAAGGTNYAGGLFWYANSGIGQNSWKQIVDLSNDRALTSGLLWPRMATSNNRVYVIGTYEDSRRISGVYNPIVYYCYNTTTQKFESKGITLPGYDSTRYGSGSADEYSIDARDNYVAILIGGYTSDLALWKSTDSGKTFVKTMIDTFVHAPYQYKIDPVFTDTVLTDDGTGSVAIDQNGVVHVSYSPVYITNPTSGDSSVNYFAANNGITYWNDRDKVQLRVGEAFDFDGSNFADIPAANNSETEAGYGHNWCTFSNIALDAQGHIYVVYSAVHETDVSLDGADYRHVYCSVFDGTAWHAPQDIVQTWQLEDVYATVARDADTKLHLVYMQDPEPGIYIPNSNSTQSITADDTMIYEEVSTTDLLNDKVGLINLGVNENVANNMFKTGALYPNPASDVMNISVDMVHSANLTVKLFNVLGEQVESQDYGTLPTGMNTLQLNTGSLSPGVYMCNMTSGGYTATQRVVISR